MCVHSEPWQQEPQPRPGAPLPKRVDVVSCAAQAGENGDVHVLCQRHVPQAQEGYVPESACPEVHWLETTGCTCMQCRWLASRHEPSTPLVSLSSALGRMPMVVPPAACVRAGLAQGLAARHSCVLCACLPTLAPRQAAFITPKLLPPVAGGRWALGVTGCGDDWRGCASGLVSRCLSYLSAGDSPQLRSACRAPRPAPHAWQQERCVPPSCQGPVRDRRGLSAALSRFQSRSSRTMTPMTCLRPLIVL